MKLDVIIPTFGRSSQQVNHTLNSIYKCYDFYLVNEVIVVDQNMPNLILDDKADKLKHIKGEKPSLPNARNIGVQNCSSDIVIFFDDDVEVKGGIFNAYIESFKLMPEIDFVAGREILPEEFLKDLNNSFVSKIKNLIRNRRFKKLNFPVAHISKNGFFYCDFSQKREDFPEVDTVRGCNFGVKKSKYISVQGFDIRFTRSAYREESDFVLRLRAKGSRGIFNSNAEVLHLRQAGGCNNLSLSLKSLRSKLDNELLFQIKHFPDTLIPMFVLRILPIVLDHLKSTKGRSFILLFKYSIKFNNSKNNGNREF